MSRQPSLTTPGLGGLDHELAGPPGPSRRVRGSSRRTTWWTLVALVLAAANMRPAIAVVGPVLHDIQQTTGLSTQALAVLTGLPVLCFGLLAPLAPPLSRRIGLELTLAVALAVLLGGMLLRLAPGSPSLFAGTVVLAAGVALMNVLLPVIVKRDFPARIGLVTGIYTTVINVSAAVAAGTGAPLAARADGSWRVAFLPWVFPAVVAVAVWLTLVRRPQPAAHRPPSPRRRMRHLLSDPLARRIVAFTAAQSVIYYSVLAWLPYIFTSHGLSTTRAGAMLFVTTMVSAPVALLVPSLASHAHSQHRHVAVVGLCTIAGLGGILLAPLAVPYLWVTLLGVGIGGAFPLALTMFGLRTNDESMTADLSMLAQCLAYIVATAGPLLLGVLFDASGSWSAGLVLLLLVAVVQLFTGVGAGRPGVVGSPRPRPTTP